MRGTVCKRLRRMASIAASKTPPGATLTGTRQGQPANTQNIYRQLKSEYKGKASFLLPLNQPRIQIE